MKTNRMISCFIIIIVLGNLIACNIGESKKISVEQEIQVDGLNLTENIAEVDTNLLNNGDFSIGTEGWGLFVTQGGVAEWSVSDQKAIVAIDSAGTQDYSVQLYYDGFPLKMGGIYELSFTISCDIERQIKPRIQLNGGDYKGYLEEIIEVGPNKQTFQFSFEMVDGSDPAPRLCFNIGQLEEEQLKKHAIEIDDVFVKIIDSSNIVETEINMIRAEINLNQVGYLPESRKIAVLRGENYNEEFEVINQKGEVAFKGKVSSPVYNKTADEMNSYADFSELKEEGIYQIKSGNAQDSCFFSIKKNLYQELLVDSFKMLYYQRCGSELFQEQAGDFAHVACHTKEAIIYGTNEKKEVSGGWHDAGDYGRYVVPASITIADLLLTYQDYPEVIEEYIGDSSGIPESNNGICDLFDEVRYELEWLLKMQDDKSGGVYHKVSCLEFCDFIMPEEEQEELYLAPISTAATADFAAIMAMSYRFYKTIDSEFSDSCLKSAKRAWEYLENTRNVAGFKNPKEFLTGEYGDGQDKDERYWASVELLKSTGEKKYKDFVEQSLEKYILHGLGWSDVGTYGNIEYLSLNNDLKNEALETKMINAMREQANKYLASAKQDGYGISLQEDYMWGSNMAICNYARQMKLIGEIDKNVELLDYVQEHFHYLLGKNPVSTCFITGYGTIFPNETHHRPSSAIGKTLKGMLVGGPDRYLEDPYAKSVLAEEPPAKCYIDNIQSYSCNEITIYWNSPFIYLLADMIDNYQ